MVEFPLSLLFNFTFLRSNIDKECYTCDHSLPLVNSTHKITNSSLLITLSFQDSASSTRTIIINASFSLVHANGNSVFRSYSSTETSATSQIIFSHSKNWLGFNHCGCQDALNLQFNINHLFLVSDIPAFGSTTFFQLLLLHVEELADSLTEEMEEPNTALENNRIRVEIDKKTNTINIVDKSSQRLHFSQRVTS